MNNNNLNQVYRNVKKTDWKKFTAELNNNINLCTGTSLDEMAEDLEKSLISAFEKSCKEVKVSKSKKPPW
jgi:hypothetical protein